MEHNWDDGLSVFPVCIENIARQHGDTLRKSVNFSESPFLFDQSRQTTLRNYNEYCKIEGKMYLDELSESLLDLGFDYHETWKSNLDEVWLWIHSIWSTTFSKKELDYITLTQYHVITSVLKIASLSPIAEGTPIASMELCAQPNGDGITTKEIYCNLFQIVLHSRYLTPTDMFTEHIKKHDPYCDDYIKLEEEGHERNKTSDNHI